MQDDVVENNVPPSPATVIRLLRAKGHSVHIRRTKNGSWRYSVDGRPETNALVMTNRYERAERKGGSHGHG